VQSTNFLKRNKSYIALLQIFTLEAADMPLYTTTKSLITAGACTISFETASGDNYHCQLTSEVALLSGPLVVINFSPPARV